MTKLKQAHGNWVVGPDKFWNRDFEVASFIEYLNEGANILLVAQRRIGKTSLMKEVSRTIEKDYFCIYIDLQNSFKAEDFVVELSAATHPFHSLWRKTKDVFSNVFNKAAEKIDSLQIEELKIKFRDGLVGANWEIKANRLLDILSNAEKPVVVFIDEVPILVNRILKDDDYKITNERVKATDKFMSWLRSNSIKHQGKIRFVLTGSIGLEPILRQAGLSATINTFKPFDLKPWDEDTAIGCLKALSNQYGVSFKQSAYEHIIMKLACCVPHHVQMFFSHIYEFCKQHAYKTCTIEIVDKVYETRMLSSKGHAELSTFEERLKLMVGEEILPFAIDLLTEAAVVGHLSSEAANIYCTEYELRGQKGREVLRMALEILEHDGYLKEDSGKFVFISKLLRDWWRARHKFGFVPATERRVS
ncbi:MAG: ATP-binding protein [bacterium]